LSKEILVTGGAGFIGSELTRLLQSKGHRITVFDNLSFGRKDNIWKGIRFVRGDLRSPKELRRAFDRRYDFVFHLAALHFIPYCNEHPDEAIAVNVTGTWNLLQALRPRPPERFFFASTAAVYGPQDRRHRETETPEPIDIYGISKLAGETMVREFSRETGIPGVIGRLFNAFGPRETNPHLIPHILKQIREGKRVLQLGNLKPWRDYIHTSDIARAIWELTRRRSQGIALANIGSGKEHSVREVVTAFETALGERIRIRSVQTLRRKTERLHLCPDLNRLRRLTDFKARVSLAEGIRMLLSEEGLTAS
jgi:UDP-glucose 4-epimerase